MPDMAREEFLSVKHVVCSFSQQDVSTPIGPSLVVQNRTSSVASTVLFCTTEEGPIVVEMSC